MSRDAALDDVRVAFGELFAAQRRLRGREQGRHGRLSWAQINALALLAEQGEATPGAIAKHAELTPASVTGMLDALERDGIVARRRSSEDRRVVLVSLTEHGRELLEERRARWRERWQDALEGLSEDQIGATTIAMRRMAALLDEM
ncbi:MAG: hypothetical protein QOJ07_1114 [Thermoleophilaceae bacterium]|nr:hypothetical protein [Thermoleophilaceae bacterium]